MNIGKFLFGEHAIRNGVILALIGALITFINSEHFTIDSFTLTRFQLCVRIVIQILAIIMTAVGVLIAVTVITYKRQLKKKSERITKIHEIVREYEEHHIDVSEAILRIKMLK